MRLAISLPGIKVTASQNNLRIKAPPWMRKERHPSVLSRFFPCVLFLARFCGKRRSESLNFTANLDTARGGPLPVASSTRLGEPWRYSARSDLNECPLRHSCRHEVSGSCTHCGLEATYKEAFLRPITLLLGTNRVEMSKVLCVLAAISIVAFMVDAVNQGKQQGKSMWWRETLHFESF